MYVCTWFNKKLNRIKVENIRPDGKVSDFKSYVLGALDKEVGNYELTYRGSILKDDKRLNDYEIVDDSEIHLIEKFDPELESSIFITEEAQDIVGMYRLLTQNPGFRSNVQRIVRSDALYDIHRCIPEILEDTIASSILFDPELLLHLTDFKTVCLLREKHPSLIHAASLLARYLRDQNNQMHQQPSTSTGYSYSLDALSDDEDMDSNTESSRDSHPITRNSSFNAITTAQLAAAIANATNTACSSNSAVISSSPSSSSNIITNEMFSNALQQAFGNTPIGTPPMTPGDHEESNLTNLAVRYEIELKQMHELGLLNDRNNIRALMASSGNLHEAVELVLSGMMEF